MGVTLFHQPEAGETPWSPEHLLDALRGAGLEAAYQSTKEERWQEAFAATRALAIVAGGDGTVARVAAALPDRSVPLAFLPLGSANDIARSLGYDDSDLGRLIAGLRDPQESAFRVGGVHGRWGHRRFVESIGLGAMARSVSELQDDGLSGGDKRRAGREQLARIVETIEPVRASVCADGRLLAEPALLVELMNIPMIGPNLRLCEAVEPGDDHLHVVWLPEAARADMAAWLADPEERGAAPLQSLRARAVEIDAHDEALRIDDKTVEWDGHRLSLRLEDEPLRVLVPRRTA